MITRILIILFITFFYGNFIFPQISPGDLTNAHAHLEGLSNCTKCHELGQQVLVSKCLDCHTEINTLIDSNRGYHSSSEVRNKDCWNCHSEHHGRNFRIINFDKNKFDHKKTGYELTGSHTDLDCAKCHNPSKIIDQKLKKKKSTYLGLSSDCSSCHEDFHQGTLDNNCIDCHTTAKFRPAFKFDHNRTKYPLTGQHRIVDCIKCHTIEMRNGKEFQKFSGISYSNCSSCHNDVHKGDFGGDCKSCHSTRGFNFINESAFDHSKTNFPLIGKHRSVTCNNCHKEGLSVKPAHSKCTDCHADYHKGQFTTNNIVSDCRSCHNEYSFSPSLFSIDDHNKTEFKLTGSHLAVPCRNCHIKSDEWQFREIGIECIDCHNNVHGSELTAEFLPDNDCRNCHNPDNWHTINFDHDKTSFDLLGKHQTADCNNCHVSAEISGEKQYRFASLSSNCTSCHKDIHFGQFEEYGSSSCLKCHTFYNWKPDKFNHSNTRFTLQGAHSKLKCSKCHKPVTLNGNTFTQFKLEDFKCAACHS
jgi:hypothetical protein